MPWGNAAAIGLTAGHELNTTVMPFILRGGSLLGIDSVECPATLRGEIWQRLSDELKHNLIDQLIHKVIPLNQLPEVFADILSGQGIGRILVETAQ
jgi:NADPH2:quinone reductase